MIEVNNRSLLNNLGLLFLATYSLYFLMLPLLFSLGYVNEQLIYSLYTRKGLLFITYESYYYIVSGMITFSVGYFYLGRNVYLNKDVESFFNREWSYRNILVGAAVLFGGGIFSKILGVIKGAHNHPHYWSSIVDSQLINFFIVFNSLQVLSLILLCYGYVLARKNKDNYWKHLFLRIFSFLFVVMLLLTLSHGSKALTLGIVFPIIVLLSGGISVKKSLIVVFGLFALTVMVMLSKSIVEVYYTENLNSIGLDESVEGFVGRVNQSHIATQVIVAGGEPLGFIVLQEFYEHLKPKKYRINIIQNGNDFAKDYGFINENDNVTGVGRTIIGGLYIAFGYIGIVVGLLILGVIYKLIQASVVTQVGLVFYCFTLLNMLLRIEQDIVFLINTLTFHFVIVLVTHLCVMKGGVIDFIYNVSRNK